MIHRKIDFDKTRSFSPFFLDYIQQKEPLKRFYNSFPVPENFIHQIQEKSKSYPASNRVALHKALADQYKNLPVSDPVKENLTSLLNVKTFTITTGHQLNICTGPLYFIYKIVTVINACRQLKIKYPEYNFVPVYWMASEDHDYDEIKYFRLYGKKYTWETSQRGAVGKFNTTGLDALLKELPGDVSLFKEAYSKHQKLSDAVRCYVNYLFGKEGLVILDGDDKELKALFKDVVHDDLTRHSSKKLVDAADESLRELGYKTQVYCRDINFFYLEENLRERIEKQNDRYLVLNTDISFNREDLEKLIERAPEKFSPNVILRPLYQEFILPNLAYVGGPAEVVYWLQLKAVFDHFKTPFPILMPRNFALTIEHPVYRKFQKTGMDLGDIFEDKDHLFNRWVTKNTHHNLSNDQERQAVAEIFRKLKEKAEAIDKTLSSFVGAEEKRALNSLEKMEKKFFRAEKRHHTEKLGQLEAVKNALFPNGNPQERTDNFLNFYQQDPEFIQKLLQYFDPFDFQFNILIYES